MICQEQVIQENPVFMGSSIEMQQFEKDITYFYNAPNPDNISKHYLEALKQLESIGVDAGNQELEVKMLPHLENAYSEILRQTQLEFNAKNAARLELDLILSQAERRPFEYIYQSMVKLYQEVFGSNNINIHKAAMLRTFLYQYKISLLQNEVSLTVNDKMVMQSIAKASEHELQRINVSNIHLSQS